MPRGASGGCGPRRSQLSALGIREADLHNMLDRFSSAAPVILGVGEKGEPWPADLEVLVSRLELKSDALRV